MRPMESACCDVSIVLPVFNEAGSLRLMFDENRSAMDPLGKP